MQVSLPDTRVVRRVFLSVPYLVMAACSEPAASNAPATVKEPEAVANQAPDHARGDVDVGGHATGPTHQAPAIGAKLQSGVVSLSRKGEPQNAQSEERRGNPQARHSPG